MTMTMTQSNQLYLNLRIETLIMKVFTRLFKSQKSLSME